jgi:hypothetical protein
MKTETNKPTRTRAKKTTEATQVSEKQKQAAKPATPAKQTRSKKTAEATPAIGKQKQSAEAATMVGKQGASASGKATKAAPPAELRGGTKQVLMTEAVIPGRGGRPAGIEDYPFGELPEAYKDENGTIKGVSFFIPLTDKAEGKLAAARKRHRDADGTPALFWSRKVFQQINGVGPVVEGLLIWRGTSKLKGQV